MPKRSDAGGAAPKPTITIVNSEARWIRFPIQWIHPRFAKLLPHQRQVQNRVVQIGPGANTIDAEDWALIRSAGDEKIDLAEKWIDDGILREIEKPIHTMPVGEAVAIVKLTIDMPILLGVKGKDKRQKVQDAVEKQIAAISQDAHTKQAS